MWKASAIFIFLALTLGMLQAQAPNGAAPSDTSAARNQAWRADLQHLATELPNRHRNLFFKVSRENFLREVAALNEAIPRLQDFEIKIALLRLLAMIGDSHTSLTWRREDFSVFPLRVYQFSEGLFVTSTSEEHKAALGARLVQIGEMDVAQVLARMRRLRACENDWCYLSSLPEFIIVPEFLQAEGVIASRQQSSFVFEDKNGKKFKLDLKAVAPEQQPQIKWTALPLPPTEREQILYLLKQNINYWYEYVPRSGTLYFAYNHCGEMPSQPFRKFTEELLAFMDSHEIERFVIDLRRNTGGNEGLLLPFIAELKKRPAINRRGRLFVITGRATFSSAAQNAFTLKQSTRAITVGEPTGQKPNHYGQVRTFRLPNSGIEVRYSTVFWKLVDEDPAAFMPDILAGPSFNALSSGRDPAMNTILLHEQVDD